MIWPAALAPLIWGVAGIVAVVMLKRYVQAPSRTQGNGGRNGGPGRVVPLHPRSRAAA
jgi:hypothetical protein